MENVQHKGNMKNQNTMDHVAKNTMRFAGIHLLVDLWEATNLNSVEEIEALLKSCAVAAGATLLHSYMHPFQPQGVSGVVVLAESHISIHTWPENNYAALDIFMCGDADPYKAIPLLREYFKPKTVQISEQKRGIVA